ncbi:hypothetical protein AWB76_04085 [Caballeronia temeraria]|uniref:Uncharacterized protein n=1 Tax=Caballeronia temeraria TaxID=1777137 RepID=A0A158BDZ4_9BURK|nr:hypothetical protein [Caballeronia temeraria]SAK68305.1 hypothetical protein AWB76_04085 [Caballeronia temeraria]
MESSLLMNVGGMVLAAGVTYGAIRADLKNLHERIALLEKIVFKPLTKGA